MNFEVRRCCNTWMYCDGNCSSCPYNTTTAVDRIPMKVSGVIDTKLEYPSSRTVQYVELSQETIDKIADAVVRRIKDERTDNFEGVGVLTEEDYWKETRNEYLN